MLYDGELVFGFKAEREDRVSGRNCRGNSVGGAGVGGECGICVEGGEGQEECSGWEEKRSERGREEWDMTRCWMRCMRRKWLGLAAFQLEGKGISIPLNDGC